MKKQIDLFNNFLHFNTKEIKYFIKIKVKKVFKIGYKITIIIYEEYKKLLQTKKKIN